ncbi:MAG TPA: SIMPL domain-containing protein [Anaerolineales bacterium]|nr:SIMPL domain-containing protein [Anaerolineales bacterium]
MKNKSLIVLTVMAVAALLLSACGPTTIQQTTQRTLSVSGNGQAYLAPDIAYIYVGVHTEKTTAAAAVAENTTQTQAVIASLKKAGIDEKDLRTTNFSIYPQDKFDPQTGTPTGEKTYVVDNTVYVTVRKLDQLGDLLDTVVQAGANSVNSVQFDVVNKADALKQARADAVKDAESQAKELADAAGLSLGAVQSINFIDNQPIVFDGKGGGGGIAPQAASVPIQTGQLSFTVTVNVTYALK